MDDRTYIRGPLPGSLRATVAPGRPLLLDRMGLSVSALCLLHCLGTVLAAALLASAGGVMGSPLVHEGGMVVALLLGALALGGGLMRHGRRLPLLVGGCGLAVMAAALSLPHGAQEMALTVLGVAILAAAHIMNMRSDR